MKIDNKILKIHPYVNPIAVDQGRTIWLAPVYLGDKKWDFQYPVGDKLISLQVHDFARSIYLGTKKASEEDIENELISLIIQHLNFKENIQIIKPIIDDIFNFQTIKRKLAYYKNCTQLQGNVSGLMIGNFVLTDMEYLFFLSRSFYDLIYNIVVSMFEKIVNLKDGSKLVDNKLPTTFRKIILKDNSQTRTAIEIYEKWGLPVWIGEVFESQADFFPKLRWIRDQIGHGNGEIGTIFTSSGEISVKITDKPFNSFKAIWGDKTKFKNDLAPLEVFVDYIIQRTITFSNKVAISIHRNLHQLPEETFPNLRVIIREEMFSKEKQDITNNA